MVMSRKEIYFGCRCSFPVRVFFLAAQLRWKLHSQNKVSLDLLLIYDINALMEKR